MESIAPMNEWIIAGHSMGGGVSVNIAIEEDVQALLLYCPAPQSEFPKQMKGIMTSKLMKGFMKKRPIDASLAKAIDADGEAFSDKLQGGLPAINLTAHAALIAAVGNDLGGDVVYAQQVMGYGRAGDVLLGISTSGNADNVSKAVRVAKAMGMKTIGLTGIGGGKLYSLCDVTIRVSADSTPDIQELHLPVYHALCSMIESEFFTV